MQAAPKKEKFVPQTRKMKRAQKALHDRAVKKQLKEMKRDMAAAPGPGPIVIPEDAGFVAVESGSITDAEEVN